MSGLSPTTDQDARGAAPPRRSVIEILNRAERRAGESLGARLGRLRCLPVADVIDFGVQAAARLAAAHARGLAFGRLGREDLLLMPDLSMLRGERVELRERGATRREGPPSAAEVRRDLEALAAVLYQALGGVPTGFRRREGGVWQEPLRLRALNPDVPPALEALLTRALTGRPRPFRSIAEFSRALARTRRAAVRARNRAFSTAIAAAAVCGILIGAEGGPGRRVLASSGPVAAGSRSSPEVRTRPRGPRIVPLADGVAAPQARKGRAEGGKKRREAVVVVAAREVHRPTIVEPEGAPGRRR